ncbi:MAG: PD-(D/E)XK nuclease family protein [Nanoarchaeota archaeon]|mgnify:CR=1 FL=1
MVNLIQEYRPNGIAVTDLSSQLWCEKQLEFALEKGRKETAEMKAGKERHRELHEEIAILVKVEPKTLVDSVALRLHNAQVGLNRLLLTGMTREIPLFGKINSLFIMGVTDEIILKNNSLHILDTKTRKSNSMPSEAQKRTTRFQLMLYNKIIQDLVGAKFTTENILNFYDFKASDKISDNFKKQINNIGDQIEPNIKKLSDKTFRLFQKLPVPEKIMKIRYEFQERRKLIGSDEFSFDNDIFQRNFNFVEEFWLGKRKAIPVGINNAWKCKYCEFYDICEEKPVPTKYL